jgi:DNA-binding MurR/RpiR family transcriptional regulator
MSWRRLLVVGVMVVAPVAALAQRPATRFEITAVTDSTLSFRMATARWLKSGSAGVAVDPRRRDQQVARFQVLAIADGVAIALITGQTTDVSIDHVATVVEPETPWYRRRSFWLGLLLGSALGAAGGAAAL